MGVRTSTSTPRNDETETRLSLAQLKYQTNIRLGMYHNLVINHNFTDDSLSGEVTTEWPEVEATKEEYPLTSRNQDIVEDPEADISKVSTKIDLKALSYKARAGRTTPSRS